MESAEPSISVKSVSIAYNGESIIENISFQYTGTGIIQIIGPNGAGKSTLLKGIAGLLKIKSGRVEVMGRDITGKPFIASRYISLVPQLTITERGINFPISARELLSFEARVSGEKVRSIEEVAEIVGLKREELDMDLRTMSGGQKQKVFIARALLHDRPIILLDEPLSSIDPSSRAEIAEKLTELSEWKLIITTSHDPAVFMEKTKKILVLNRSFYYFGNPEEVMREEVLEKVYGKLIMRDGRHIHIFDDSCAHLMKK